MPRLRRFGALVAAITGCLTVGAFASAGLADPLDTSTTTTSTMASSTTSTTADSSTTTTEPASSTTLSTRPPPLGGITQVTQPPSTTTTTGPPGSTSSTVAGGGTGTTDTTLGEGDSGANVPRGVVPPDAQAQIDSYPRSPANSTTKLINALQPLVDMGIPAEQAYVLGFGRFPVAGPANFVDDWLFPRWDGSFHFHHGTDIFAVGGTPVRAVADGVMRQDSDRLGGTVVYVKEPNGTYYYYAHLSGYVEGQVSGQEVKTGEVVGYVGNSGDAQGGATHLHFEVHPDGGGPVDPKDYLDQWLADALADAPRLVSAVRVAKGSGVTPALRSQVIPAAAFPAPAAPARSQLLWASSANPQGGALQLAEAVASEAARSVDWKAEAREQQQRQLEWVQAEVWARSVALPLLPTGLLPVADPTPRVTLSDRR